jgi:hypothetical protein
MYEDYFGFRSYGPLRDQFKDESSAIDQARLDAEVKRRLVEEAPPDQEALNALAAARAQLVYDFMIAEGFDPARVRIGPSRETQSTMGHVPLEFTLTVVGDLPEAGVIAEAPGEH